MASWEWVVLGLLLLALAQLVALQYARRLGSDEGDGERPRPTPGTPFETQPDVDEEPPREPATGTAVQCPHCGSENDPAFTYCRECVSPIP